jgi:hypothetical protein
MIWNSVIKYASFGCTDLCAILEFCIEIALFSFRVQIILPSDTFKEVLYLKLQFPLHFEVKSVKKPGVNESMPSTCCSNQYPHRNSRPENCFVSEPFPVQYCGVLEFSAKIGNAYLPQWMMQNLRLKNKDKVNILAPSTSIPLGQYCKLQPHTEAFFDLLQEMGPRNLLESAMRGYSVLSAGERLIIQANGESHSVNVVQVKPGSCVSILGCLDLEVDIATPLDFKPKPGGPRPAGNFFILFFCIIEVALSVFSSYYYSSS